MVKKIAIGFGIFLVSIYVLFLVLPFCLSGLANSYSAQISKMVEDACGFKIKLENIRILTTPKLTVGGGVGHVEVALPTGETFLTLDNAQAKLSLLPIFARKIEVDLVGADNININLKVKKDGKFLLEDYIPQTSEPQKSENAQKSPSQVSLPFGIRLSNHLPNIVVNNYNISFIDIQSDKSYSIYGDTAYISDFILNKKIKVAANGKFMLQDKVQFNYDFKVLNKVMPDIDLHDMVFAPQEQANASTANQTVAVNVIDIFKAIHKNQLTADLKADLTTSGTFDNMHFDGFCNISNMGIAVDGRKLPPSNVDIKFNGNKIDMYTKLYTASQEITELVGRFKTGKSPNIDLNCKSNAKFASLINMVDSIAKSFGYKELDTLSATGGIDADFNIKSNLKKIESSGYLKISNASINYGLYNASVDNIKADIDFANNMVNVKDAGLSILSQPLTIKGSIAQDADVQVRADKLQIKSLLLATGQMALLKDNRINSGTVSLNVDLKGKLEKLAPKVKVSLDNVNIKNVPIDTTLSLANAMVDLVVDTKGIAGKATLLDGKVLNPAASLFAPSAKVSLDTNNINIDNARLVFEGNNIDVTGKISDYLTENIKLNLDAIGLGEIHLKGSINDVYKSQKLNINLATSKTLSTSIPGFKNSNLKADANIDIIGTALNPILKGNVIIPTITMPDMLLTLEGLNIHLNGPIVKGNGTLKKFVTGGIVAENLSADFSLKNNVFYLNKIVGDAFSGKVNGDISYNIVNGLIGVKFTGAGMDSEKAVAGAVGIKNALSGTLGFGADVTFSGATDIEMMKNLKGNVTFEIKDGFLGNIGRLENLLFASNIQSNGILKTAVSSVSSLPAIKNTAEFKTINGKLTFDKGWANLVPVQTSGPSMAYYITGKYNLLNGTANVIILGRLAAEVVALLGPLGDLSLDKLTAYIPKFGALTGNLINAMTSDPSKERVDLIPALSSGETVYKDFKVEFNGGLESKSSVKSFKWLSVCDTSGLDALTVKEQVQETKQAVKDAVKQNVESINTMVQQQKEQAQQAKQQLLDAKESAKESLKELKNLFKY